MDRLFRRRASPYRARPSGNDSEIVGKGRALRPSRMIPPAHHYFLPMTSLPKMVFLYKGPPLLFILPNPKLSIYM